MPELRDEDAAAVSVDDPTTAPDSIPTQSGDEPTAASPVFELAQGAVLAGRYRVEHVIGTGGMGIIYAGRHLALDEPVALKVLRPSMISVPGMVARFLREARAASRIKSEHVARVIDVDTLPSGTPYIVMEYLAGLDLSMLRRKVGRLPIAEAATYVAQACDAIAEAHSLGVVHRDLKPSNLFVVRRRDGKNTIKVLDFGISKVDGASDQDATSSGMTMGTPKYMSPEQMKSLHDTDGRTDIWSLGTILYELLAGRPPFVADSMVKVCVLVVEGKPPPLRQFRPDVPPALEAIVMRCLQKPPGDRFATADELARALAPFTVEAPVEELRLEDVLIEEEPPPRHETPLVETPLVIDARRPAESVPPSMPRSTHPPSSPPTAALTRWNALSIAPPAPRRTWRGAASAAAVAALLGGAALMLPRAGGDPENAASAEPAANAEPRPIMPTETFSAVAPGPAVWFEAMARGVKHPGATRRAVAADADAAGRRAPVGAQVVAAPAAAPVLPAAARLQTPARSSASRDSASAEPSSGALNAPRPVRVPRFDPFRGSRN